MAKTLESNNNKDIQIVVMGPKGCGKSFFLNSLVKDQSQKKQINNLIEAYSYYDLNYKDYNVTFIETHDEARIFDSCLRLGSKSDGIILMCSMEYDFPLGYFENICQSIRHKNELIKDKKPITFFLLQSPGSGGFNSEKSIRQEENVNVISKFIRNEKAIYLGIVKSYNEEANYIDLMGKIVNTKEIKKEKPEDNKKKTGKIFGLFNFHCYSNKKNNNSKYG